MDFVALWTRISVVTKEELPLPNHIKQFIWNVITSSPDIEFYVLPEPRPKLVIFNRNDYIDPDLGAIIDPVIAILTWNTELCGLTIYCKF